MLHLCKVVLRKFKSGLSVVPIKMIFKEISFNQDRREPVRAPGYFIALGPGGQSIFY